MIKHRVFKNGTSRILQSMVIIWSVVLFVSCGTNKKEVMYTHQNGKPQKIEYCSYKGNKRIVNKVEYYYSDGILQLEYTLKNGLQHGNSVTYYQNGEKRLQESYKEGKLNGKTIEFYVTGKPSYEASFKDNMPDGTWFYYDENGKLYNTQVFRNGKLVE